MPTTISYRMSENDKRHCLRIGEWPLAFNGDSYGVGTAPKTASLAGRPPPASTAGNTITGVMNMAVARPRL